MGSKSSLSSSAMAESIIMRTLSRRTTADSGEVVCVNGIGRTEGSTTLPLDNACRMLLLVLKAVRLVLVSCASDGDFMVVVAVVKYFT
jgi:hypothetical protein